VSLHDPTSGVFEKSIGSGDDSVNLLNPLAGLL
jgi:hypothetical protein